MKSYKDFLDTIPNSDHPETFGQHSNAIVIAQMYEANTFFDNLLMILPKKVSAVEEKHVEQKVSLQNNRKALLSYLANQVLTVANEILKKIPKLIDMQSIERHSIVHNDTFTSVLFQEVFHLFVKQSHFSTRKSIFRVNFIIHSFR